ncbi:hypothetical protein KP509_37G040700 [Ceratopteris richardii]|uniref:Protein disulfide-isomerase SCO2 n=1 Tax=Ceratopteris richardii TaxID=49495 RepID=A0A8T2Q887_CERRI|nr:hypothetical protein KP509_37G040700 [Ceratopteris richardii]
MLHARSLHQVDSSLDFHGILSEGTVPVQVLRFPSIIKVAPLRRFHIRSLTTSVPAIDPDDLPQPLGERLSPPSVNGKHIWRPQIIPKLKGPSRSFRNQEWRVYANNNGKNERWRKDDESSLSKDEALPLPMSYPGSTPDPQEVEDMENCDPEMKDCGDVLYQWVGKCSRCQGTGEVSYFPKKGREIICKCIPCMGLGHVQLKDSLHYSYDEHNLHIVLTS